MDFPDYAERTVDTWNELADWWEEAIGGGNPTQDHLVEPTQERLLDIGPGDRVLDIGCGAARFTRRLADRGARLVAFDHSERFIALARAATPPEVADSIEYHVLDASDERAVTSLGKQAFDAAVCTMALMDMAVVTPLLRALKTVLVPGGIFVFSVTHPVFNSGDAHLIGKQVVRDRSVEVKLSAVVTDYLTPRAQRDVGISGQPVEQDSFHRPIGLLLNVCFDHGFVLDRFEEPRLPEPPIGPERSRVSWSNVTDLPQVLVVRLRLR